MCQICAKPTEANSLIPCSFISPFHDVDGTLETKVFKASDGPS